MKIEDTRVKTGGRQKGTLNKKTEILNALGIETYQQLTEKVILEYLELLQSDKTELKLFALRELTKIIFKSESSMKYYCKEMLNEPQSYTSPFET